MQFAGMNYIAVVAAAAGGFVFGAVYYMTLGKVWMAATGKTEESLTGGMAKPLIVTAIAQLLMASMLGGILGHLGAEQINVKGGLITGAFVWLGFSVTATTVNYVWQRARPMLMVIDGGHWLGCLLIQGAILGAMGV